MTREEAIQVLSQRPMIASSKSNKQKIFEEAIDMAIEALSDERLYTHEEAWGMTDLISRADAIEAVEQAIFNHDSAIMRITELPSARPTGEWIPCEERLPSENGEYLCTIPLDENETYTEVLTYHKGRFYEDDDEWGATFYNDVIAWMPLPEPYKGGDAE